MLILNAHILDPRGHTPAINQSFGVRVCVCVCVAGARERQADTLKNSRIAVPTLLHQGNILIGE
jgi:hypothetical protein